MKKLTIILVTIFLNAALQAAVTKTVNCTTKGTLHTYFTVGERTTVTDLTLTGTIDARDFKFMRDTLTVLAKLDLSAVNIAAYGGTSGTFTTSYWDYGVNAIPQQAFYSGTGYSKLSSILLPTSLTGIEDGAFGNCTLLTSIIIPATVTYLGGGGVFHNCTILKYIQFNNPIGVPLIPGMTDGSYYLGSNLPNPCYIFVPNGSSGYIGPVFLNGWGLESYPNFTVIPGTKEQYFPTAIQSNILNYPTITKQGDNALISGLTIGENLEVYSIQGQIVYNTSITQDIVTINFPTQGMYIIKVGNWTSKVIIE
jgi:hypothetical protein